MRKSIVAIAVLAIAVAASLAYAGTKANVISSMHDIGYSAGPPIVPGTGCKSCHAPHNGSVATGGTDQATGKILLWDRGFTTQTFGTYTSPSLDNAATEVGTTTPVATDARLVSFLCLSCHDGVTSPTLIGATDVHAVGNPTNSYGLENDHPVNMAYDPALDAGLDTVANVTTAGIVLYGATDTVQCGSCHDPHDPTNTPFLRVANTNSALCLTCHL